MNLDKKKKLAIRTLNVGKKRIIFVKSRLNEISEAITKQDIRELHKSNAIIIKDVKGRKKSVKGIKRRHGKIKIRIRNRKREYIYLTRKLRKYIEELRKQGKISEKEFKDLRKNIRNKIFKSKSHLKEYLGEMKA